MIDVPILYSFRRCPYAMRARLALAVSGSTCILREVALRDKPAELIAASPKATIPVLVLPCATVIDESLDIMRWALSRNDPEAWLQADPETAEGLIAVNDGAFKHHLDRYKYPDRHEGNPLEHRSSGMEILSSLDDRLALRSNLCRETRSLADAAIMPFVRQFAQVDRPWFDSQKVPNLQRWLNSHLSSALFEAIAIRVPPWKRDDPVILFPDSLCR